MEEDEAPFHGGRRKERKLSWNKKTATIENTGVRGTTIALRICHISSHL
jgi:hypothetical protein